MNNIEDAPSHVMVWIKIKLNDGGAFWNIGVYQEQQWHSFCAHGKSPLVDCEKVIGWLPIEEPEE